MWAARPLIISAAVMLRLSSLLRHLRRPRGHPRWVTTGRKLLSSPARQRRPCLARGSSSAAASATATAADVTLYTAKSSFPAFNGWKLTILLEELQLAGALSFAVRELDLDALEHKQEWCVVVTDAMKGRQQAAGTTHDC